MNALWLELEINYIHRVEQVKHCFCIYTIFKYREKIIKTWTKYNRLKDNFNTRVSLFSKMETVDSNHVLSCLLVKNTDTSLVNVKSSVK